MVEIDSQNISSSSQQSEDDQEQLITPRASNLEQEDETDASEVPRGKTDETPSETNGNAHNGHVSSEQQQTEGSKPAPIETSQEALLLSQENKPYKMMSPVEEEQSEATSVFSGCDPDGRSFPKSTSSRLVITESLQEEPSSPTKVAEQEEGGPTAATSATTSRNSSEEDVADTACADKELNDPPLPPASPEATTSISSRQRRGEVVTTHDEAPLSPLENDPPSTILQIHQLGAGTGMDTIEKEQPPDNNNDENSESSSQQNIPMMNSLQIPPMHPHSILQGAYHAQQQLSMQQQQAMAGAPPAPAYIHPYAAPPATVLMSSHQPFTSPLPMPPSSNGKRKIFLRLVEVVGQEEAPSTVDSRRSRTSLLLGSFRRRTSIRNSFGNIMDLEPETPATSATPAFGRGSKELHRGKITVSWYEGTSSTELQEHVHRTVLRKLQLTSSSKTKIQDVSIWDDSVNPPEGM